MQEIVDKWETLRKALNHSAAVAKVTPVTAPADSPMPHPDHMPKVQYGTRNIPGAFDHHESKSTSQSKMGFLKDGGKSFVVRHGGAAHRTDVEHQMSKLLGVDHMLPEQHYDHGINHPGHHGKETFDPHEHAGTSFQEHSDGKTFHKEGVLDEGSPESNKLREHWKNGDLHKLWALHYISNNADMHSGNFNIGKDGLKAYDSDHAFYELPTAHIIQSYGNGKHELEYMPHAQNQLPAYLSPFIDRENDEDIKPSFKDDQVHVNALNEHAKKINPDLFKEFGPHAADRARQVKKALSSANPTEEMQKLWDSHSDKTGDILFNKKAA